MDSRAASALPLASAAPGLVPRVEYGGATYVVAREWRGYLVLVNERTGTECKALVRDVATLTEGAPR